MVAARQVAPAVLTRRGAGRGQRRRRVCRSGRGAGWLAVRPVVSGGVAETAVRWQMRLGMQAGG